MSASKVVWIIGTPFSGSTLLQNKLHLFPEVFVAGEIDRLRMYDSHPHLREIYIDECGFCAARGRDCNIWTRDVLAKLERAGVSMEIYDILSEASGAPVIVDCSKTPYWYHRLISSGTLARSRAQLFTILCVRNPFAYAVSMQERTGLTFQQCVFDWLIVNKDCLKQINRVKPAPLCLTILHDDFRMDQDGHARHLQVSLGLAPAPSSAVIPEYHYLGGNPNAYPSDMRDRLQKPATGVPGQDVVMHGYSRPQEDMLWRDRITKSMRRTLADLDGVRSMCHILGIDIERLIRA